MVGSFNFNSKLSEYVSDICVSACIETLTFFISYNNTGLS